VKIIASQALALVCLCISTFRPFCSLTNTAVIISANGQKEEPRCGRARPQGGKSLRPKIDRRTAEREGSESGSSTMDQAAELVTAIMPAFLVVHPHQSIKHFSEASSRESSSVGCEVRSSTILVRMSAFAACTCLGRTVRSSSSTASHRVFANRLAWVILGLNCSLDLPAEESFLYCTPLTHDSNECVRTSLQPGPLDPDIQGRLSFPLVSDRWKVTTL
jgi:hypothetical protein